MSLIAPHGRCVAWTFVNGWRLILVRCEIIVKKFLISAAFRWFSSWIPLRANWTRTGSRFWERSLKRVLENCCCLTNLGWVVGWIDVTSVAIWRNITDPTQTGSRIYNSIRELASFLNISWIPIVVGSGVGSPSQRASALVPVQRGHDRHSQFVFWVAFNLVDVVLELLVVLVLLQMVLQVGVEVVHNRKIIYLKFFWI